MKLLTLYRSILDYCGLSADDAGAVHMVYEDDEPVATMVEGRRLALPTKAMFDAYDPDKMVIFHPLQEHINRGASEVVKSLQKRINTRINLTTIALASNLLTLAGSKALHSQLTPEQRELLKAVPNADLKSSANFVSFIAKKFVGNETSCISNIFLKKAGTYQGVKHARIGVVTFPYYDLFEGKPDLRVNDQSDFIKLMEFIFPGSHEESEAYNAFSDSNDAPWLDALLKASYMLTQRLNELVDMFADYISSNEATKFNVDWVDAMDNIDALRAEIRRIPSQKGNEGTILSEKGGEQSTLAAVKSAAPVVQGSPSRPTPASREQVQDDGPYRRDTQQPLPAYDPRYPQVQQPAYDPRYPQVQQPVYDPRYPAPQQPAPGLRMTESGKLDLRSVSATVPAVAMAGVVASSWANQQMYQDPRLQQPVYVDPRTGRAMAPQAQPQYYDPRLDPRLQQQQQYYDPRLDPRNQQPQYYDPRLDPRNQGGQISNI